MTAAEQQAIVASDKISEVLKHHPQVLEELIALSPHFEKLRNPVLRKVQSRLVTVSQAAAIAGLEPGDVTRRLNIAAGLTERVPDQPVTLGNASPETPPDWLANVSIVSELDARPILERGEEPFRQIMDTAAHVAAGAAFRLVAGFEPVPLYDVLARQGFDYAARRRTEDCWEVVSYRRHAALDSRGGDQPSAVHISDELDWESSATARVTIDVSELVPPEPMIKVLEALQALPDGGRLLVHHIRRPIHLYDRLDELGYQHETRVPGPGKVDLLIQKRVTGAT